LLFKEHFYELFVCFYLLEMTEINLDGEVYGSLSSQRPDTVYFLIYA
jgi:hypothetical protein